MANRLHYNSQRAYKAKLSLTERLTLSRELVRTDMLVVLKAHLHCDWQNTKDFLNVTRQKISCIK